jgi:cytochrome c nitrite reductase small subunit
VDATSPLFTGPAGAHGIPWFAVLAALVGAVAAILLIWAFIRGSLPAAYSAAAVLLPVAAYGLASMHMLEGSKQTEFCGSCHVMTPVQKSVQGNDGSLASIHYARGLVPHDQACYTCHSGYGIWGGVDAKLAGVRHMLLTVTGGYTLPVAMHAPFDINSCLGCHAYAASFRAVEAHQDPDLQKQLLSREMSCTGVCHPPAHPETALTGGGPAS